jgi:hypothetical protein
MTHEKKDMAGNGSRLAPATSAAGTEVSPSLHDTAPPTGAEPATNAALPPRAAAWLDTLGRVARRAATTTRQATEDPDLLSSQDKAQ